jgi:uncharacterized protein YdaU (DUF1376 family)
MTKKTDIWMPLYIADYMSATSRLTTEEHGAYLLILMDYWKSGAPPDNDRVLSQITRLSPDAWSNARRMLEAFFIIEDGKWIHKRVEQELLKSKENRQFAHDRAVKGAKTRWENASSNASSTPQAMLDECTSPSPSQTNNKTLMSSGDDGTVKVDYQGIVDLYNRILPELPAVKTITNKRRSAMRTCATTKTKYSGLDFWEAYFTAIRKSDFLMGRKTNWKADFDFVVRHSQFIKIIEGGHQ